MSINLVAELTPDALAVKRFQMDTVSPDDGKYAQPDLVPYLSQWAEWRACAYVQKVLLETRRDFWFASDSDVVAVTEAMSQIDPVNMALIESKVTKHDQLAVIEEIGRFVSSDVKALLHPGTTSYDILDTARSHLLKKVWQEKLRWVVAQTITSLVEIAEDLNTPTSDGKIRALQVGRTHLQSTSPVPFWATLAGYAARLADRLEKCDQSFGKLKWKVSGIVGTQSSVAVVVGKHNAMDFERQALAKLWLEPDYTATQIVQKESLSDVWHSLTSLMRVLWDFANDMRVLYSTSIGEVTSLDAAARRWGSSADAGKNNPINWENIAGKVAVVESGMRVLYEMIQTDFQRDLRGSVQARYQPNQMISEVYESFKRVNRELKQLSVNETRMAQNLEYVRKSPTEALVAILRWEQWEHSVHGVGHDFVKWISQQAQKTGRNVIEIAKQDWEFLALYQSLSEEKKAIIDWQIEHYIGTSLERAQKNIAYSRAVVTHKVGEIVA